jgi:EF hand domain-containing protein
MCLAISCFVAFEGLMRLNFHNFLLPFATHQLKKSCKLVGAAAILPLVVACSSGREGDIEVIRHPAYQWDLNENGAVTRTEYLEFRRGIFFGADEDRNGYLDENEWDDIRDDDETGIRRAAFIALDFSGDGNLSLDELMSIPDHDFLSLDQNSDGVISSAELSNASKTRARGGLRRRAPDEGFRRNPDSNI